MTSPTALLLGALPAVRLAFHAERGADLHALCSGSGRGSEHFVDHGAEERRGSVSVRRFGHALNMGAAGGEVKS